MFISISGVQMSFKLPRISPHLNYVITNYMGSIKYRLNVSDFSRTSPTAYSLVVLEQNNSGLFFSWLRKLNIRNVVSNLLFQLTYCRNICDSNGFSYGLLCCRHINYWKYFSCCYPNGDDCFTSWYMYISYITWEIILNAYSSGIFDIQ